MCGLAGYIGTDAASPFLCEALKRLEYRGYDSWGLATLSYKECRFPYVEKGLGRFDPEIVKCYTQGNLGIAHTRWATSSAPSIRDAHPIAGGRSALQGGATCWVVHNGIITNYKELKEKLEFAGYLFLTNTDTEVISHTFDWYGKQYPTETALRKTCLELKGQYAFALISSKFPNQLLVAADGAPLVVSRKGHCVSDVAALSGYTKEAWRLNAGTAAILGIGTINIFTLEGVSIQLESLQKVKVPETSTSYLGKYPHYMLKEIEEQKKTPTKKLKILRSSEIPFNNVILFGCGSSYHAGMVGKKYINDLTDMPAKVEYSTEIVDSFVRDSDEKYIALTQSGETQDTVRAIEKIKEDVNRGKICCITNNKDSRAAHLSDEIVELECGQEKGVAATKTYTYQLIRLLELAAELGWATDTISELIGKLPHLLTQIIDRRKEIAEIAKEVAKYHHIIFLGRHYLYPAAKEAALKMKEVSYIHAEASHAAEIKHGPLALIDEKTLSIMLVSGDDADILDKIAGNISEIEARNGRVIIICDEKAGERFVGRKDVFTISSEGYLHPICFGVTTQILAYETAVLKGINPDFPRSLAKSITVE